MSTYRDKAEEPCCDAWRKSSNSGTDNESYGRLRWDLDGEWHFGCDLPAVKFCSWCGASKSTADSALPVLRSMVTVAAPPYLSKDCGVTITEVCNHYCWEQPDSADADPTLPPPASP